MMRRTRATLIALSMLAVLGSLGLAIGQPEPGPWALVTVPAEQVTPGALDGLDVDVEGGSPERLQLQIRASQLPQLVERGLDVEVLTEDTQTLRPGVSNPEERGGGYHDPEGMTWSLRALADTYPDVVRVVEVGRSWQGRAITGVIISDNPWTREPDEPSMRILGAHQHALADQARNQFNLVLTFSGESRRARAAREIGIQPIVKGSVEQHILALLGLSYRHAHQQHRNDEAHC